MNNARYYTTTIIVEFASCKYYDNDENINKLLMDEYIIIVHTLEFTKFLHITFYDC